MLVKPVNDFLTGIYIIQVTHNKKEGTFICSCNHFVRCGILCRHIFCVFKVRGIHEIPERYISRRWRRDIIAPSLRNKTHRFQGQMTEECQKLANLATQSVETCIVALRNDPEKLSNYVKQLENLKSEVEETVPVKKKTEIFEEIIGVKKPNLIEIQNPKGIKNKGSGSNIRMQGYGEKAQEQNERAYRLCSICGLLVNDHDRRTCLRKQQERLQKEQQERLQKEQERLQQHTSGTNPEGGNDTVKTTSKKKSSLQEMPRRQTRGKKVSYQLQDEDSDSDYEA